VRGEERKKIGHWGHEKNPPKMKIQRTCLKTRHKTIEYLGSEVAQVVVAHGYDNWLRIGQTRIQSQI